MADACRHWISSERRRCGAVPTRLYLPGRRCTEHTPARLAGRPEPSEFPVQEDTRMDTEAVAAELKAMIRDAAANAPRSLQVAIGPSEIGHGCTQRLARKILDWPKVNDGGDPLPSIDGTAFHAWVAEAFERANGGQ